MKRTVSMLVRAAASGVLLLAGACSTEFKLPLPVPPPVASHTVDVPFAAAWTASLRALDRLGYVPERLDWRNGRFTTRFKLLPGNSARHRTAGVARVSVERDVYRRGRVRLHLALAPLSEEATRVTVAAEPEAQVRARGEIRYATASVRHTAFPLLHRGGAHATVPTAAADGWEPLTSNGVLEDEFLAAFAGVLAERAGADPGGRPAPRP